MVLSSLIRIKLMASLETTKYSCRTSPNFDLERRGLVLSDFLGLGRPLYTPVSLETLSFFQYLKEWRHLLVAFETNGLSDATHPVRL